jgi:hypothetical protein
MIDERYAVTSSMMVAKQKYVREGILVNDVLDSLELLDINQLCLHEEHEPLRLRRTSQAIKDNGFLLHPILATHMNDGRYLVLDGVHRTGALGLLGARKVPVQVVKEIDLSMEVWSHLVTEGDWINRLLNDGTLKWSDKETGYQGFAQIIDATGRRLILNVNRIQDDFLLVWHKIVSSYTKNNEVSRIPQGSCIVPDKGKVLITFSAFALEELKRIVQKGQVLPAGVTRFQVNGRLLNLKIPLRFLTCQESRDQEWIRQFEEWRQSLRLYTEQVYLCEI